MRNWLPSRRIPPAAALYLLVILASTAVLIGGLAMADAGDPSFAAIYLVLFAFPSSIVAMVPTTVSDSDVAGVSSLVLLMAAGFFQVWLVWWTILDRRRSRGC